jgi:hypothetical protein
MPCNEKDPLIVHFGWGNPLKLVSGAIQPMIMLSEPSLPHRFPRGAGQRPFHFLI